MSKMSIWWLKKTEMNNTVYLLYLYSCKSDADMVFTWDQDYLWLYVYINIHLNNFAMHPTDIMLLFIETVTHLLREK